jgi:hypothetical protein
MNREESIPISAVVYQQLMTNKTPGKKPDSIQPRINLKARIDP